MERRPCVLGFIFFMVWIFLLSYSSPLFPQMPAEQERKTGAPSKESALKGPALSGFLRDISVSPGPQGVKIELVGDGLVFSYRTFKLSQPPRFVIDFPNVFSSYPKKIIALNHPLLTEIRFGQHSDKLRLVFAFPGAETPPFEIERKDKGLVLWIGKGKKDSGEARKAMEERREIPIEAPPEGKGVPEKVPVTGAAPQEEKKEGSQEPGIREETRTAYSGAKISLDYVNADIRNIFRLLAEAGKVEIIPAPEVRGTITLRLIEVPWDEALDSILNVHNLKKVRDGNRIRIFPQPK
jgi:hypothetical protein